MCRPGNPRISIRGPMGRKNGSSRNAKSPASGGEGPGLLRVLLVGQGAPTAGGIPSFITDLTEDEWLLGRVRVEFLNTAPSWTKSPGRMSWGNVRQITRDALSIFRGAMRSDVVHLNLAPAPLLPLLRAIVLVVVVRLTRSRVILHAHTGRLEKCAGDPLYRFFLRVCLRLVHILVVVSKASQEAIGGLRGNAVHLANGVNLAAIEPAPRFVSPPSIVFVGTVCERKGLIDLRDALIKIRRDMHAEALPAHVLIVGDARQEGPGVFERIQLSYGDANLDEVRFLGVLDRPHVLEILRRCDIFCLPSHWEGSPLSLLEAMAAGAAIVATRVGDVPSILEQGKSGLLIDPGDHEALAHALVRLLSDDEERVRLGYEARRRVEDAFDRSDVIRRIYDLYLEAADRS
jgi:glycosyltransferase involved in cell wall biosynthesis